MESVATNTNSTDPAKGKSRFFSTWIRLRRFFPAIAFIGGFLWDSITLGKVVTSTDLWVLGFYYLGAYVCALLLTRVAAPTWQLRIGSAMQFCFGGMFSALVVFYFKSSGSAGGYAVVVALIALLIVNEFLRERYVRTALTWSLLLLAGAMYLNFVVPHLVHGVGTFWFVLSSTIALLLLWVPWKLSRQGRFVLLLPIIVYVALQAFWFTGFIPPVPLVVKQHLVCKDFSKEGGNWHCMEPAQDFLVGLGWDKPVLYHDAGESFYYLSSVFAPSRVRADLEHRWYRKDSTGSWIATDTITFAMVGGREEGWRLYSNKVSLVPGVWRVETALQEGAVIGRTEFVIPEGSEPANGAYIRREFR